jgi:cell division protein DivIC
MKNRTGNKVSQLDTPYVHKFSADQQRRQFHKRRCQRIIIAFLVIFLVLGIQIVRSRRTLAKVNNNIAACQTELKDQQQTSRHLKYQIKLLHDPEYVQQVLRAKYNYSKKGETIYNLNN